MDRRQDIGSFAKYFFENITVSTGEWKLSFSTVGKKVYYKVAEVQKLLDSGRIEVATKE